MRRRASVGLLQRDHRVLQGHRMIHTSANTATAGLIPSRSANAVTRRSSGVPAPAPAGADASRRRERSDDEEENNRHGIDRADGRQEAVPVLLPPQISAPARPALRPFEFGAPRPLAIPMGLVEAAASVVRAVGGGGGHQDEPEHGCHPHEGEQASERQTFERLRRLTAASWATSRRAVRNFQLSVIIQVHG